MDYVYIGKFLGTHGLKGEIKLKSDFKYIDRVLKKGFCFYIGFDKKKEIFLRFRVHKGNYLILFEGLEDINLVEKYINQKVYVLRDDLSLSSDQFVYEDYIGLSCYFNDKCFGMIDDIVNYGNSNYVFLIKDSIKEIIIPFNDNFIDYVKNDNIYFKNVEGFIDEN